MRSIRYSITFNNQLTELLDQGEAKFGRAVVDSKKNIVYDTIYRHLANFPGTARREEAHGLFVYQIGKTPFVVLFEYDDNELRIHFVVHNRADRSRIDPAGIEW